MMRAGVIVLACLLSVGCSDSYRTERLDEPAPPTDQPGPSDVTTTASPEGSAGAGLGNSTEPTGGSTAEANDATVSLPALTLTAPESWVRKPPQSGFVAAEFNLPRADGDENDGRLTISTAGGSVQDNIDRWRTQFGGQPQDASQRELDIAGTKVTVVDLSGTYNDQPGPFAPGIERAGYRMLAAIIPVGGQLHFVKAYGPAKTMAQHAEAFHAFLQTLQLK